MHVRGVPGAGAEETGGVVKELRSGRWSFYIKDSLAFEEAADRAGYATMFESAGHFQGNVIVALMELKPKGHV